MSYLVFPGAHHTRFHHALGCMHLMQKSVEVLRLKGVKISEAEEEGLLIAILLHDIGHGPFSHAMENSIVNGVSHEQISLQFMQKMNAHFNQSLTLAIQIFKGEYPRKFFCQLIASQLDMDRMDYLKRDSFYTGVPEGNINGDRLIAMLNVVNDELVVEEKGIYSVEKFLIARRLMYWQVYLHKTSFAAEQLLIRILKRAKFLVWQGKALPATSAFSYFLEKKINASNFNSGTLEIFAHLDDSDLVSAMKEWQFCDDFVLRNLCEMIIDRKLVKVKVKKTPFSAEKIQKQLKKWSEKYGLSVEETAYFVFTGEISNLAYERKKGNILILHKNGKISDVAKASDQLNIEALSTPVTKYYFCYPK